MCSRLKPQHSLAVAKCCVARGFTKCSQPKQRECCDLVFQAEEAERQEEEEGEEEREEEEDGTLITKETHSRSLTTSY